MKTSNLLWLFGLLAFTNGASWAETNPQRAWTNLAGKTFSGLFIRSDGVSAWIKPGTGAPVKVTVAELSAADQKAVVELNQDFSWKLRTVRWPEQVLAPATRPAVPVAGKREDKNYEYRTPTFSFLTDEPLNGKLVGEFGCVFEATYELLKQLPWEIRPTPADDGQFFHVRLISDRAAFLLAVKSREQPGTKLEGIYNPNDGLIYVPFDSLNLRKGKESWEAGGKYDNDTLRHELTHQMMHHMLKVMPWWVAEGTAEYVRLIPWDGRGGYAAGRAGSSSVMRQIAQENEYHPTVLPELLENKYTSPADGQMEVLAKARSHVNDYLIRRREARKAVVERLKAELDGKKQQRQDVVDAEIHGLPLRSAESATKILLGDPRGLNEQPVIISKYHASKLLVYYLQHLDGTGKGTRMLNLMWKLRQWADEYAVQSKLFTAGVDRFRKDLEDLEVKVKGMSADENSWEQAMQVFAQQYVANRQLAVVPPGPEEALLTQLPTLPSADHVGAKGMQARWNAIRNEVLPEKPEVLAANIAAAFAAKKIFLK